MVSAPFKNVRFLNQKITTMHRIDIGTCVRDNDEAFVLAKTRNSTPLYSVPVGEQICLLLWND